MVLLENKKPKIISLMLIIFFIVGLISTSNTAQALTVGKPTITSISNGTKGVVLKWKKPSKAKGYYVYRKNGSGSYKKLATIKSSSTLIYTDKTCKSGTKYAYVIKAYNGKKISSSKSKSIRYLNRPILSVYNKSSGILLDWNKVSGAKSYNVYYKKSGTWTKLATVTSSSYIDKSLKSGKIRSYYVKAVSSDSYKSVSSTVKSIKRLTTPSIKVTTTSSGVKVSWNKVSHAKKYIVYYKKSGNWCKLGETTGLTYTNTSIKRGETRTYSVKAISDSYSSYRSNSVTIKRPLEDNLVFHLKVVNGVVTDVVSGKKLSGFTVSDGYIKTGTITLPNSYSNWTYNMILDYNEDSTKGVVSLMKFWSNSGKYEECDNVFRLEEVSAIHNRGVVKIPWVKDSWNSGYIVRLPIQLYAHASTDYEYLPVGDSFWSFSMNSDKGILNSRINGATTSTEMSKYTDSNGNTKYVSKILPQSFSLTGAHKVKEIKIYNKAISTTEQEIAYEKANIIVPKSGINKVVNGLTGMGSSFFFSRETNGETILLKSALEKGNYTISTDYGRKASYSIIDFIQPNNNIDNSKYEDVNITNEPKTINVGKQYPLTAYPYPFTVKGNNGKASEFDISWTSSDNSIITVIDGLLIAKKPGTVEITATLMGTNISDTVKIKVIKPEEIKDNAWNVPSDYTSKDGYSFSNTDYEMTTRAIYAAIDEAKANGYNHIIFPKQKFYAVPILDSTGNSVRYYVPSNMTIEFPEGSEFHMMDNEISRGDPTKFELHYFELGVKTNDYVNKCENSHIIIDTYYGERHNNTTHKETEYLEENRFVNIGRKAVDCSVEVRNAYGVSGYFIVADGVSSTNKTTGVMKYRDFVNGWLNEEGNLESNSNWISTSEFITVPNYGKDGYFLSADGQDSYAGKYWNGCLARQYDILWYDENKNLIKTERFLGRGEYYTLPENAAYFKVSLQQTDLPTPASDETIDSPWIALHDDGSAKMCEIKNTRVSNSACGIFSVVGQTDGLWIHDCYTGADGKKPYNERTGDFENGWTAMRHSVVSNNFLKGYFGNPGGFNTFIHTNYMENYSGFGGETEMLRFINNTTDYVEISEKSQAHIYYNTLYGIGIDRFSTSLGNIYKANNETGKWVRSY